MAPRFGRTAMVLALLAAPLAAQTPTINPDIAAATARYEKRDGFLPLYLDTAQGRIFLELPRDSTRALFFATLATGLGSNPVGLDRGADGPNHVVRFERSGPRMLVVFENWSYRSSARDNPAHQRSVAEAFAPSTVAALPIVAAQGGRFVVDATEFFIRDWMEVAARLQQTQQGTYTLARERSAVYRPYTRAYPRNTEVDVSLTFTTSGRPGPIVNAVVPDGSALTLREHVSLLELPDDRYRPRAHDPRTGYFGITFRDYAQPLQGSLEQRWIARHRLERVDPRDPRSAIRNPIVYYMDRGIPEPVRAAMLEGARWWEQAFAQAGLPGGFRVEDLPEDADPMDARYNVLQWENRHERGWSIGGSLGDPRTGEIVKAMARLDSHRGRTDYNLYAALMGADPSPRDTAFVLARLRQVTAHEIGHTLGLAHNYIASISERSSVMDYPPPRVRLGPDGAIDVRQAYASGPGVFDVWAVRWGYGIFPPESEAESLAAIVREGLARGLLFLSDGDARPEFASDPRTNLWDDAPSAGEFLRHQMDVRRAAMARFGERNIRPGQPLALLHERFVPLYFWHRFAITSVAKTIGGMEYAYVVRGDGQQATRPVAAARQRAALSQLLDALEPAELVIPDTVVTLLGPRPGGYGAPAVEQFGSRTQPALDVFGAAQTLAHMVVDQVLQRERTARLAAARLHDPAALTYGETVDSLVARTWRTPAGDDPRAASFRRIAARAVTDRLLALAADREASPFVRSMTEYRLSQLVARARLLSRAGPEPARAFWYTVAGDLTRWIERRELPAPTPPLRAPPGDPFGIP